MGRQCHILVSEVILFCSCQITTTVLLTSAEKSIFEISSTISSSGCPSYLMIFGSKYIPVLSSHLLVRYNTKNSTVVAANTAVITLYSHFLMHSPRHIVSLFPM